ncbi:hypothetical protein F0562_034025 [Nyssa sinensis]|uniref:Uncharacterized protein n=1 Tax=Nyssa sinensis TaxID=561372 RepID=A0A5J5AHF0_9ASTE|nr:hypothetical protein F0562_034025 [Nyssa sinensis]
MSTQRRFAPATELEKRKRIDNGEINGKKKKARDDIGGKKATTTTTEDDEEVEEFFAILRRIHVAVKYFEKSDKNAGRNLTAWNPSFEWEDFEEARPKSVGERTGLDLNADPASNESDVSKYSDLKALVFLFCCCSCS